jgi:hypothetical protein
MWRRLGMIGWVAIALLWSSTAVRAQGPETQHADPYWQAAYWNNMSLAGVPVLEETAEYLAFDWGYGSPHPSVSSDQFSARWSRIVDLAEATYRFSVTSDDGVRVYVDDRLIIDEWRDQAAQTFTRDLALQAGHHEIVVEYYENTGVAKVALSWAPLSAPAGEWQGEYYANGGLNGSPVLVRTDREIDFDWGYGSPASVVPADGFSVRWTRLVHLQKGRYRFVARPDDGIRLYVDQRLAIDAWYDQAGQTHVYQADLEAGDHLLVVEYYENMGAAAVQVSWTLEDAVAGEWRREFYANPTLSGAPNGIRSDPEIDFDWGYGKVGPGGPTDNFSIRWTRTLALEAGTYRFTATSDDGIRAYVDGRPIIDGWYDHAAQSYSAELNLASGPHEVVVEYYEHTGVAQVRFSWTRLPGGLQGWDAAYYGNRWLGGTPVVTRRDENIDFDWGTGSPAAGIPSDGFSARWTRTVHFEEGMYRFTATTDDGVRLWVNGHLLIDEWRDQWFQPHSDDMHVSGDVPVVMEYYENGGAAAARLSWMRVDMSSPPPSAGEVIVDDGSAGFAQGGSSTAWHAAAGGYGGGLTWTRNNDRVRANYNWARWYPELEAGRYEVYVYVPQQRATTTEARYWVSHYDGLTLRKVNQAANGGQWVSLGTYRFRSGSGSYVSLADVTGEGYLSTEIAFDAVKWVPR